MEENRDNAFKRKAGLKSPVTWLRFLLIIALSFGVVISQAVGMGVVGRLNLPALFATAAGEVLPLLLAALLMIVFGGRKWLGIDGESIRYAFRIGWVLPALGLAVSIISVADFIRDGNVWPSDSLLNLAAVVLTCLLIGFFEEIFYRGINFGAMLSVLGGSRTGVMIAVLISSYMFGRGSFCKGRIRFIAENGSCVSQ